MTSSPSVSPGFDATSTVRREIAPSWRRAAAFATERSSDSAGTCTGCGSSRRDPVRAGRRSNGSAGSRRTRSSCAGRRPTGARPRVLLTAFLKPRARVAIEREIARHAAPLGVSPSAVSVRDQRTRWGSASREGRLAFSWRLILAPPEALETVVIHELAHLRVFGHGPRFWALVASRRADHRTWRRWLREHSTELHGALDKDGAG